MKYQVNKKTLDEGIHEQIKMEINNLESNLIKHVNFVKGHIRIENEIELGKGKEIKELAIKNFPHHVIGIGNRLACLESFGYFLDVKEVFKYQKVVSEIINNCLEDLKNYQL